VYEVWSKDGAQVHRSGPSTRLPTAPLAAIGISYRYDTLDAAGDRWRAITGTTTIGGRPYVLRVSRSEERLRQQLWEVLVVLALGAPLVVALAGAGGYLLARRALVPINRLASEAQRITAERLHERLTAANETDEIGRLTTVINATFARLEGSFDQLRRFTADASHELRTPLAVIRGLGEAAVAQRRTSAEYQEAIGSMLEEVDRMSSLVDTLLRLSHGDAGTIRLSRHPIDVGALVREVASSLGVLAEERTQTVALDVADGLIVPVDRLVLREAITNVLDNAIKYGPAGSTIDIRVGRSNGDAFVTIGDEGAGIPPEHRERIFDRFFRVDEARSRDRGGAGLGLAIAKWAVEIHGGAISVAARAGGGSEFRIVVPRAGERHGLGGQPEMQALTGGQ
jgi:heavy metal sensor kinase